MHSKFQDSVVGAQVKRKRKNVKTGEKWVFVEERLNIVGHGRVH